MSAARAHRPRTGALWPAYLASFTFMLGQWASGVAVPLEVGALGGSLVQAGSIAAIRFGLGAVFSLPFGAVADAWGTRRTLTVAVTANALIHLVPILAVVSGSLLPLYAWAVLSGLASSLFLPANSAYVAGTARPEARGSAFGWLTLATHTGVASGPAVGGLVWQSVGAAPTFLVASGMGFVAMLAPLFVARTIRTRVDLRGLPRMVVGVARDRVIVGSWLAALGIGLPWGAVSGLFPLFGTSLGIAAGSVGLLLGLQSIANGASRVPLGRLIDRRALPPAVAGATCLLYAAVTSLLGLQTGPLGIAIVFVAGIWALAFTLMMVQVTISERRPPRCGRPASAGTRPSCRPASASAPLWRARRPMRVGSDSGSPAPRAWGVRSPWSPGCCCLVVAGRSRRARTPRGPPVQEPARISASRAGSMLPPLMTTTR